MPTSLPASLALRIEDEEDDVGGVGYGGTVMRSCLMPCREMSPGGNGCWNATVSVSMGVLGAVGKAPFAGAKATFDAVSTVSMAVIKWGWEKDLRSLGLVKGLSRT